jgi:cyclophilin family peptidyl-prolyl cis-trans isomerase
MALTLSCGPTDKQAAPSQAAAKEGAAAKEAGAPKTASSETGAALTEAAAPKQEGEKKEPAKQEPAKTEPAKPAETAMQPTSDPAVQAARDFIASKTIDKTAQSWKTKLPMPPKLTFEPERKYFWLLTTTEGPIKIRLMPDVAPMHVSSTIYLTELGFYDGTKFHRVIPQFMAQGGDPLGTGMGGPGYKYAGEFSPTVKHSKGGLLSMANAGPGTDGSQFFLTFVPTPHLDGKHTIFGEVVEGMENLMKLEKSGSQSGQTSKLLAIQTAKIVHD